MNLPPSNVRQLDHLTVTGSRSTEKVTPAWWNASPAQLLKLVAKYEATLEEVRGELEDDFDVIDGTDGQPRPNKAMRLANLIDETLYGPGGF